MPDQPPHEQLDPEELGRLDGLLREMAPDHAPPVDLRPRTLAAVAEVGALKRRRRMTGRGARRTLGVVATAAAAAVAIVVVAFEDDETAAPLVLRATLSAPDRPGVSGDAQVIETGIGREIAFFTDELPILPMGQYYELWFVGPGDFPGRPNRISAGTFHPDPQGRSRVRFSAAVDPKLYPVLSVTAEPGDGDPHPSATEVLRSRPTS